MSTPEAPPAGRHRVRGAILVLVMLAPVLFFQGCSNSGTQLSIGPFGTMAVFEYEDETLLPSQVLEVSRRGILANVVGAVAVILAAVWFPRFHRVLTSKRLLISLFLAGALFNSVLFPATGQLWQQAVFLPIDWLCSAVDRVTGGVPTTWQPFTIAAVARTHYLICTTLGLLLTSSALKLSEKYLLFDRRRWWQVNLRTLLVVTFLTGSGLGMLLRLSGP